MKKTFAALSLVFASIGFLVCQGCARREMNATVEKTIATSLATLRRSAASVDDSLCFPSHGKEGKWKVKSSANWVSGFYGGCQWYAYAISGDSVYDSLARRWTMGIEKEKYNRNTHDLGFRFMCTFGNGIRFSKDDAFRSYCGPVRDTASVTLSHRFLPQAGVLSSDWDNEPVEGTVPCVIDIMMNLEILFETALSTGDRRLYDIAVSHANTTWKDFVRPDGGTYHIVRYDAVTGEVRDKGQLQGDTKESTWSRGHAWLVYGMVVAYRYTKDPAYLEYAKKSADYFIAHLNDDNVAPWDFQSGDRQPDASASAVVASALYEMISYLPEGKERKHYSEWADKMLLALCGPEYFIGGETDCLLDHSVQYYHLGYNVGKPSIYADYYFMEALYRYKSLYLH